MMRNHLKIIPCPSGGFSVEIYEGVPLPTNYDDPASKYQVNDGEELIEFLSGIYLYDLRPLEAKRKMTVRWWGGEEWHERQQCTFEGEDAAWETYPGGVICMGDAKSGLIIPIDSLISIEMEQST